MIAHITSFLRSPWLQIPLIHHSILPSKFSECLEEISSNFFLFLVCLFQKYYTYTHTWALDHIISWFAFISCISRHLIVGQKLTFIFNPHLKIYLLILERGREREKDQCEKYWLVASHTCPKWGLYLPHRYVPWPEIEPATFWCMGWCSNQLSHQARARLTFLIQLHNA